MYTKPTEVTQPTLFNIGYIDDTERYYTDQIITYIGNKRAILPAISNAVAQVAEHLQKPKLRILDGFAGSGIVSRLFKAYTYELVANDLESYSRVINRCYLTNQSEINLEELKRVVNELNQTITEREAGHPPGFLERLYAPKNDYNIQKDERVFYTRSNARRLDMYRQFIESEPPEWFDLLMGPLLASASVHTNTSGMFKSFHKNRHTGIGSFGGTGSDALSRITGQIRLQTPILSAYESDVTVYQTDTSDLISQVGGFDLAYFDPPYNQHPYGSNYFMLNLLVDYQEPDNISRVSGIPADWNRSVFNQRKEAYNKITDLISRVDSKYVLLSYNDEGFVPIGQLKKFMNKVGILHEIKLRYNTFRGCRNLSDRNKYVSEHLFLLEKN